MGIREHAVAIPVIGVAGSGKSTFINVASGSNLRVNDLLGHCLEPYTFSLDGRTVMLIDTPGFDDTTTDVLGVLKLISDHFAVLYSQGIKLAGVIYMHCIAEKHKSNLSRHNFRVFSKFYGDTCLRDVLVVANKWSRKEPDDSLVREQEVADGGEFFGPAIDVGVRMLSHDGSQASAHAILRHFIKRAPTVTPPREDSLGPEMDLCRTPTGADAVRKLTGQVEYHTKAFGELCQGIDATTPPDEGHTRQRLREEAKDSLEKIEGIRYDLERMVTNFAHENSRLEDENRRYRHDVTAQKEEAERRVWLLAEERKAREHAEAERKQAETRLAEERALWECQGIEKASFEVEQTGAKYDRAFVCGALVFALLCGSLFAFRGSTLLL